MQISCFEMANAKFGQKKRKFVNTMSVIITRTI